MSEQRSAASIAAEIAKFRCSAGIETMIAEAIKSERYRARADADRRVAEVLEAYSKRPTREEYDKARADVAELRAKLDQVDDVLMLDHIAAVNGDYRKALHELVSFEIQIHDDPAVSEIAAKRKADVAELRAEVDRLREHGYVRDQQVAERDKILSEIRQQADELGERYGIAAAGPGHEFTAALVCGIGDKVSEVVAELVEALRRFVFNQSETNPDKFEAENTRAVIAARAVLAKHSEAQKV